VSFKDGRLEGGFREVEGPFAPSAGNPLVILFASDLDAAERRVVSAGGRIVERHTFPGGRRFHFADRAGNVLGVWTKA
jgi:predicted enzyme related to lactoylglutathione lyase